MQSRMLNSMTFIHFKDYIIHNIEADIMSLMNLSCNSINLSCNLMNHTWFKLKKMTDWFLNLISSEVVETVSKYSI